MDLPIASDLPAFGPLLRDIRRARRWSQLELALQAEVSQRHLSFLESGRSQPSRDMVLLLAQALELPLAERNRLLQSAGYRGVYPQRQLEAADMQPVRAALDLLLRHHEPYPALVVDRTWNLVSANAAMGRVFGLIGDLDARWQRVCGDGPRNLLKLTLHPDGLQPFLGNLGEIAPAMLQRTAQEALRHPELAVLLDEVLRYPGLPARWRSIDLQTSPLPVVPAELRLGDARLRLFSMLTTFGTPVDLTADSLRVEHFFPADADSEALLRALAAPPPSLPHHPRPWPR